MSAMYFRNIESLQTKEKDAKAIEITVHGKNGEKLVSSNLPNTPELLGEIIDAVRATTEEKLPFWIWNGHDVNCIPGKVVARITIRFVM